MKFILMFLFIAIFSVCGCKARNAVSDAKDVVYSEPGLSTSGYYISAADLVKLMPTYSSEFYRLVQDSSQANEGGASPVFCNRITKSSSSSVSANFQHFRSSCPKFSSMSNEADRVFSLEAVVRNDIPLEFLKNTSNRSDAIYLMTLDKKFNYFFLGEMRVTRTAPDYAQLIDLCTGPYAKNCEVTVTNEGSFQKIKYCADQPQPCGGIVDIYGRRRTQTGPSNATVASESSIKLVWWAPAFEEVVKIPLQQSCTSMVKKDNGQMYVQFYAQTCPKWIFQHLNISALLFEFPIKAVANTANDYVLFDPKDGVVIGNVVREQLKDNYDRYTITDFCTAAYSKTCNLILDPTTGAIKTVKRL